MGRDVDRTPGRPRRAGVSRQVLAAASELIAERGYAGASLDAVAARAGVAKTTVYRRWPGKTDLAVAALAQRLGPLPEPDSLAGSARWLADRVGETDVHRLLTALSAESAHDADLRATLRARLRDPWVDGLAEHRGVDRDTAELAFDLVVGTLLQRATMTGTVGTADVTLVADLADRVLGERPVREDTE